MALKIGIPVWFEASPDETDIQRMPQYVVPVTYINAILGMGAQPMLVPCVGEGKVDTAQFLQEVDGLLMAGGWDVHPSYLDEEAAPWIQNPDIRRDDTEFPMLRQARELGMPVLGICRGCQVMNVAFGGTLIPDIAHFRPGAMKHSQTGERGDEWHTVKIAPESKFAKIVGDTSLATNSLHHQAVDRVAEGFAAVAWNEADGIIEAIESTTDGEFCVGVQFHPEDMWMKSEPIHNIFKAFAAAAQKYAESK